LDDGFGFAVLRDDHGLTIRLKDLKDLGGIRF
jgi:hypothetical protein